MNPSTVTTGGSSHRDRPYQTVRAGRDESNGDKDKIFGVHTKDLPALDRLLLPEGMTDPEVKERLFDCITDVAALPGMSNGAITGIGEGASEDGGHLEAVLVASMRAKAIVLRHVNYTSAKQNGLTRLKDPPAEIDEFIESVEDAMEHERDRQRSALVETLMMANYELEVAERFAEQGVLARIVEDSYLSYIGLLNTLRSFIHAAEGEWVDSYPHAIWKHHTKKLLSLRQASASYRHWLLSSYVYLREAKLEKYVNNSVTRSLWKTMDRVAANMANLRNANSGARGTATTGSTSGGGTGQTNNGTADRSKRCPRCGRTDLHPEPKADQCVIPDGLTNSQGKKLVMACSHRQAEQVIKAYKKLAQEHPDKPKKDLMVEARDQVGVS